MLFLVIFEDDKSGYFLRGDRSFRILNRSKSSRKQNKRRNVKVSFTSFQDVTKGKNEIFVNVIYKLIYLLLKIQEMFPSGLANLVNKLVHAHSFVYLICNSLGKYFLYFKPKVD